jgi:cytochrome oxidase Cu insertion factor (SCO1/SenC/PrrC family)
LILLSLCLVSVSASAQDVEDRLWDLQIVPLDLDPAPAFTLENFEGKRLSLSDFRGRPVLLYFWATW